MFVQENGKQVSHAFGAAARRMARASGFAKALLNDVASLFLRQTCWHAKSRAKNVSCSRFICNRKVYF